MVTNSFSVVHYQTDKVIRYLHNVLHSHTHLPSAFRGSCYGYEKPRLTSYVDFGHVEFRRNLKETSIRHTSI